MDDISRLFGLSFCMLVGCYVAGAIPLAFTMSEVKILDVFYLILLCVLAIYGGSVTCYYGFFYPIYVTLCIDAEFP